MDNQLLLTLGKYVLMLFSIFAVVFIIALITPALARKIDEKNPRNKLTKPDKPDDNDGENVDKCKISNDDEVD